jgi:hypothetical protein
MDSAHGPHRLLNVRLNSGVESIIKTRFLADKERACPFCIPHRKGGRRCGTSSPFTPPPLTRGQSTPSFHPISFALLGLPHLEPCCSHGQVHLRQSLVHDQLPQSSLYAPARCLSHCLDVLEHGRDVLGQYLWSHQSRLQLPLAQPCLGSLLRAL